MLLLFVADQHKWFDFYKKNGVKEFCEEQKEKGFCFEAPQESDLILASEDTMIAAQNAVIAAESLGIGSCYIGDIVENYEYHQKLFDLPEYVFPISLLCLGHYKPDHNRVFRKRFDPKFVVFEEKYHQLQMKNTKRCLKRNAKNTVQTIHMALIIMPRCFMPEKPELLSAKKWLDRFVWR